MTPRRLTYSEAVELLDTAFEVPFDGWSGNGTEGLMEATVAGLCPTEARAVLTTYTDMMAAQIDPDSFEVHKDTIEEAADLHASRIIIKTREWQ